MAILKIITVSNKESTSKLRQKSMPVTKFDAALKAFAQDMIETCEESDGAGLASIQVEDDPRFADEYKNVPAGYRPQPSLFLMHIDEIIVVVNPEILEKSAETHSRDEGCLSIPNVYGPVVRSVRIKVKFQDLDGKEIITEYSDVNARCFQHEYDHLQGVLYPDHMNKMQQMLFWKKYENSQFPRR